MEEAPYSEISEVQIKLEPRKRPPLIAQLSLPSQDGKLTLQKSLPETSSPPQVTLTKKAASDSSLHGIPAPGQKKNPDVTKVQENTTIGDGVSGSTKPPIGSPRSKAHKVQPSGHQRWPVAPRRQRADSETSGSSIFRLRRTDSGSSNRASPSPTFGQSVKEFFQKDSDAQTDVTETESATQYDSIQDFTIESPSEGPMMAAPRQSFRDLQHPSLEPTLKQHNALSLRLLLTVADFAQKVAAAHESFSSQLHSVVSQFRRASLELMKERPVEYHSSIHLAWDTLLHETEMDAQSQADTASLLIKNVYDPLVEVVQHKKSHQKKLYGFREQFDVEMAKCNEILNKVHTDYVESYHRYRVNSRDQTRNLTTYFDAHNDYVLQLAATNRMQDEYHNNALPFILEELEEIHIDTSNVLNGAMESHALLIVTKATEQTHRFEEILKVCKQVNPKGDVVNFVRSVDPDLDTDEPPVNIFKCPEIGTSGEAILKNEIITDRLTENQLKQKRIDLQKEAAELTSYVQQNQDVTQTLINICQRNLANHLYSKVYETQEDLCRKRNEIRMATIQLAAIRAQIDLLSPKQNGTMQGDDKNQANKSQQTIKGMWKKAFKSLKQKKPGDQQSPQTKAASSRRSFLKRKDSKDQPEGEFVPERESRALQRGDQDPVYRQLKRAASIRDQRKLMSQQSEGDQFHLSISSSNPNSPTERNVAYEYEGGVWDDEQD